MNRNDSTKYNILRLNTCIISGICSTVALRKNTSVELRKLQYVTQIMPKPGKATERMKKKWKETKVGNKHKNDQ